MVGPPSDQSDQMAVIFFVTGETKKGATMKYGAWIITLTLFCSSASPAFAAAPKKDLSRSVKAVAELGKNKSALTLVKNPRLVKALQTIASARQPKQ